MGTWACGVKDGPISLNIADIEELCVFETVFPTSADIWLHVVQLSEFLRKIDMALIRETGVAEDEDTILRCNHTVNSKTA